MFLKLRKKGKNERRDKKKGTRIGRSVEVLQRFIFPKQNESMKLLRSERSGTSFGETFSNYWL